MSWVDRFCHLFQKKCVICGCGDTIGLDYVQIGGWYDVVAYYHEKCLKKVASKPEQFDNRTVDWAIKIIDQVNYNKKQQAERSQALKQGIRRLKEYV